MDRRMDRKGRMGGQWVLALTMMAATILPESAIAHGTKIEYRTTQALEVQATYESGEPMANAQVTIYSPENPSDPWLTGTTDDQGRFMFMPDSTMVGNWDVQIRQAGHGDIVSIPLAGIDGSGTSFASTVRGTSEALSPLQKIVMAGVVIWGLLGTALFFSSRARKHAHS